jgi:hypothetical protein
MRALGGRGTLEYQRDLGSPIDYRQKPSLCQWRVWRPLNPKSPSWPSGAIPSAAQTGYNRRLISFKVIEFEIAHNTQTAWLAGWHPRLKPV